MFQSVGMVELICKVCGISCLSGALSRRRHHTVSMVSPFVSNGKNIRKILPLARSPLSPA